jgi:secondary thiamine-phosphate synthase enzyme
VIQQLTVPTSAQTGFIDVTAQIGALVRQRGVRQGTVFIYVPHTTCGITIQENADPGVQHDMLLVLRRLVPRADPAYQHIEDNSAAHVQASAMGFSVFVFIADGRLVLGQWQALYLTEFDGPRSRTLLVKIVADG